MKFDYTGIPFKDKGRDFNGCDCYGLLMLYYKNELGIEISDTNITADQPRRIFASYLKEVSEHWIEIDKPEKHCGIAMCLNENHPKLVTHFAVMIDEKRVLHTINKCDSMIMPLDDIRIKPFIKGFYRWQH